MEKYIEEGKKEKKIEGVRRGCEGYRVVLFQDPQYHTENWQQDQLQIQKVRTYMIT